MQSPFFVFLFSVLVIAFPFSLSTQASTIRSDNTWNDYTALAAEYSSTVGLIYEETDDGTAIGSGTIISSTNSGTWVLTAAHVVQDANSVTFTINDSTYTADSWDYYSYISDSNIAYASSVDLALVHISDTIDGAEVATLYTGTTDDLLDSVATYTGYGCTGTGTTGYSSYSYGTLHAIQNTLDSTAADEWGSSYSASVLLCDFDSPFTTWPPFSLSSADFTLPFLAVDTADDSSNDPQIDLTTAPGDTNLGSSTPLDLEGLIAPGDSGGGVFVTIDEITYLVGVNSFTSCSDGTSNSDYGDLAGCVCVCDYLGWITNSASISSQIPGDANRDGVVNGTDVTILASSWQYGTDMENPDATWEMGDFNGDGIVDGSDVTILAGNWQTNTNDNASSVSVPEPGTLGLLAGLFLTIAAGAFRRKTYF